MLDRLKSLFESETETVAPAVDQVHLAAAALLVRAAQMDGEIGGHEKQVLDRITGPSFGLSAEEAQALLALAEQEANEANDLFHWTNLINKNFEYPHKLMLVELLWQVVLADGVIDDYESNLIRRVAGLIHVSDVDAGQAKQTATVRLTADA